MYLENQKHSHTRIVQKEKIIAIQKLDNPSPKLTSNFGNGNPEPVNTGELFANKGGNVCRTWGVYADLFCTTFAGLYQTCRCHKSEIC